MSVIVLVDMDGVIVDWGAAYNWALDQAGPEASTIRRHEEQVTFNLFEGLNEDESEVVHRVMSTLNYATMEPIPGAISALKEMEKEESISVFLCTSPWLGNPNCASDKLRWVHSHLGPEWTERTIITKDKTLVVGDYLIDDKPSVDGREMPSWVQIVFDQPYNRDRDFTYRMYNWSEWRNFIRMDWVGNPFE